MEPLQFGDICKCFSCGSSLLGGEPCYVLHCGHLVCYPRCMQEDPPGSQKFRCPICQEPKAGYNDTMTNMFLGYRANGGPPSQSECEQFLSYLNFMLVPCHRAPSHDQATCAFDHSQYGKNALTRDVQKANFVTIMLCSQCKVRGPDKATVCPRCRGKLTAKQVPPLTRVEKVKTPQFPYMSISDQGTQPSSNPQFMRSNSSK